MDDKRKALEQIIEGRKELALGEELEEQHTQFVIVTLAGQSYAFLGTEVTSIAKVETITPIPGTPGFMLGVMYYQGQIESVMDVKRILGLEDTAITRRSRVIMAAAAQVQSGILVDAVQDVVDLPQRGILPTLQTVEPAKREFVAGEMKYREENVVILDLAKVFERVLGQGNGGS